MCSKTTRSMKRKTKTKAKPPRKTRSLQRDFSPPQSAESTHQLNLFPLHPEEDNSVECFFDSTESSAATLNGLVWGGGSSEEDSLCRSLTYAYSEEGTTTRSSLLEKSALRGGNKERDLSEEKWVCYEEVTSCVPEHRKKDRPKTGGGGGGGLLLSLKLDYDEIMNAWSNKGPLYIDGGDASHVVPDDALQLNINNVLLDIGNVSLLRVPDDGSSVMEGTDGKIWKLGAREEGVLRYKMKRQNRLFSKRIRYEVRKLNAEKRPRMKGRFVKRS